MRGGRNLTSKYNRTLTVTNAVSHPFGLNAGDFTVGTDNAIFAGKMKVSCETNAFRYTTNGTVPSATLGINVAAGTIVDIDGEQNIKNFRMFRSGAADATVNYETYF